LRTGRVAGGLCGPRGGLHEPFPVQLNGYQTVCDGCFAPFLFRQAQDQRFASVDEFRIAANSITRD
jgi:hypothetical protein